MRNIPFPRIGALLKGATYYPHSVRTMAKAPKQSPIGIACGFLWKY